VDKITHQYLYYNKTTAEVSSSVPECTDEGLLRAFQRLELDEGAYRKSLKSRILLQPSDPPMIRINRLIKASWEWADSIRRFIDTFYRVRKDVPNFTHYLNMHSRFCDEETGRKFGESTLWIECPPFSPEVTHYLHQLMGYIFNINCSVLDAEGKFVPYAASAPDPKPMYFNILSQDIKLNKCSIDESVLLQYVISFVFGHDRDLVENLMAHGELARPENVSYCFEVAVGCHELTLDKVVGMQERPKEWGPVYGANPDLSFSLIDMQKKR
jgi:hypothetical protein